MSVQTSDFVLHDKHFICKKWEGSPVKQIAQVSSSHHNSSYLPTSKQTSSWVEWFSGETSSRWQSFCHADTITPVNVRKLSSSSLIFLHLFLLWSSTQISAFYSSQKAAGSSALYSLVIKTKFITSAKGRRLFSLCVSPCSGGYSCVSPNSYFINGGRHSHN